MLLPVLVALAAAPVTFQTGVLTPPLVGSPSVAAMNFAKSRAAELGLDPRSTLVPGRVFSTRFGGSVHLHQTVDGLTLAGHSVIVTFDTAQRVVRFSSTLATFGQVKTAATLSPLQAINLASKEIEQAWRKTDGSPWGSAKKQAFLVNGEVHVGYLTFIPTLKHTENWHVAIDATDGTVLFTQNRAYASDGAQIYTTSPLAAGVGVTPTVATQLPHLVANDGGFLNGDRIRALNCCPTANCQADAGAARSIGSFNTPQGMVQFDVAICAQTQRASNDPATHASGDYVYTPVDPPATMVPSITNLADFDEFAEVHAYHHVSRAYEAVVGLSMGPLTRDGGFSPFHMRDTGAGGGLPTVWVNVADADFQNAMPNAMGVYVSDTLARTDNAMYLAREDMDFVLQPEQVLNSDALVIYQGSTADFAYDGPVLWHEFGHGVIHSTADWGTVVTFDERSANNESSALGEGMADVIAAMTGKRSVVGEYVGPRIDPTMSNIRNIDNVDHCPDVLWGESHQDSQHFTGAVWEIRKQFLGVDDGDTFDAAIYAALVSFPADVNFAKAAAVITASVIAAFPNVTDARMKLDTVFRARGIIGCSKVLDITNSLMTPRPYFGIAGTLFAGVNDGLTVPGPMQFKIHVPNGAKAVGMSGLMQPFGTNSRLELLASANQPITFTHSGMDLTNDAQAKTVPALGQQGDLSASLPVSVPCGGDVYIALGANGRRDRQVYELQFSVDQADSCPAVDAGLPDAGPPAPTVVRLVAPPMTLGPRVMGCNCSVGSPFALILGAMWMVRRRRR